MAYSTDEIAFLQGQRGQIPEAQDWPLEAVEGLLKFMEDEGISDPSVAIAQIGEELDREVKPKLNLGGN